MTLIDTSGNYGEGRSEELISRVIAGQRSWIHQGRGLLRARAVQTETASVPRRRFSLPRPRLLQECLAPVGSLLASEAHQRW